MLKSLTWLAGAAVVCVACSSNENGSTPTTGKGNLQVFLVPEETITGGLEPGEDEENIHDGWAVKYTRFLITVGNFRAKSSSGGQTLSDPNLYVLDMINAPTAGYVTLDKKDLAAVRFDKVGEDMPAAATGVKGLPPTTDADVKFMIEKGYSLYFEGEMTKADGQSCTPGKPTECVDAKSVKFKWGFAMGTSFDDCASAQGDTGFAVPQGGTVQVKPTIHGDHWFFSDITEGAEITKRYAQYIADSDLDHNGETTLDELANVKAADAFPATKYRLSGCVGGGVIATAFDYVKCQARTLHDFQGDGECPTRTILK